jgi:primosomal protein N' (replication factor Y) (superfamily II helicase)
VPFHSSSKPAIVKVAVPSPLRQSFDYLLPDECIRVAPGARVRVPFGRRELTGVVIAIEHDSAVSHAKLKHLLEVLDEQPLIPPHLLSLWQWAAQYYQHPIGEVMHTLMPAGLRSKGNATVKRRKSDTLLPPLTPDQPPELNQEQRSAVAAIDASQGKFTCFLLDGVTGSGKTEVYLQAIARTLEQNRQALVLVPEISLTPQTLARFRQRFDVPIAVMHSGLTPRQRLNAWLESAQGSAHIIIGTRSAIFTPLARPGLIIIDEEHDNSFKQQDGFRYSARDLGVMRARREKLPIILGSATPSLESLHNARNGRYTHLHLTMRAGKAQMPRFILVDTNSQRLADGFSDAMLDGIRVHLQRGNQVLIFINRRGFAPVLQCQDCGWAAECRHCDARMTLHRYPPHLRCHHCERRDPVNQHCPDCQGKNLYAAGAGTERCEAALQQIFKDTPVIRVDRDATRRKDELDNLLAQINQGDPCILVGTQMLAKGHHFPGVTLVGVLDADSGLFSADFRGQEFMAQLLIQVAGRAGRAEQAGEVMIQTRHSTHQNLQTLVTQGYHALAEQLLTERQSAGMPPFGHLTMIRAEAIDALAPARFLEDVRQRTRQLISDNRLQNTIEVSGPFPAPMERRANRFRQQLVLRGDSRSTLQHLLGELCAGLDGLNSGRKVRWSIDVDPQDMI